MPEVATKHVWTVREIVDYTDRYRATFTVLPDGRPAIDFPPELFDRWGTPISPRDRKLVIDTVMPHVRARKAELLDALGPKDHYPPIEKPEPEDIRDYLAEAIAARAAVLDGLRMRAKLKGLALWFMVPPDLCPVRGEVVPDGARYACAEGDPVWLLLPKIEDVPAPKATPLKRKGREWTGG